MTRAVSGTVSRKRRKKVLRMAKGFRSVRSKVFRKAREAVEKALAGKADDRWQEFLQIVQASDLSSLANTLDVDLVSFIRQILD